MQTFQETELKLKVSDPAYLEQILSDSLLASPDDGTSSRETYNDSVYYDTEDRRLYAGGFALRVRKTGEKTVATLKDSGTVTAGLFTRGEWEKDYDGQMPLVDVFSSLPIGATLRELISGKPLVPLFKTAFKRLSTDIIFNNCRIEVAADKGEVIAGDKREPIAEFELELKDGDAENLIKLGALLAERYALTVENKSKYIRGYVLAGFPVKH